MDNTASSGPPGRFQKYSPGIFLYRIKKEENQTFALDFLFEIIFAFSAPFAYLFLMCRIIHPFFCDVKFFSNIFLKKLI